MWVKVKDGCGEGVQLDHQLLLEQEEEEQMNASPRGWLGGQQLSVRVFKNVFRIEFET